MRVRCKFVDLVNPWTALLVVSMFFIGSAHASDWYFGGSVGVNGLDDQSSTGVGVREAIDFDTGEVYSIFIGRRFGQSGPGRWRVEGELAWRDNDVDDLQFNGATQSSSGSVDSFAGMINVYYDFTSNQRRWYPYIGAGIGFVDIDQEVQYGPAAFDDDDTVFGGQFMAGLTYVFSSRFEGYVQGRYLVTDDPSFTRTTPAGSANLDSEYEAYDVSVGVRVSL